MSANGAASNGATGSGSRSRPQARRKPNDDAAYTGPSSTGAKRHATDRAEGEPRVKRKRLDPASAAARRAEKAEADEEDEKSIVDFNKLPTATLHRYLSHFNLTPFIYPSQLTSTPPPAPSILLDPTRQTSRGLSPLAITTSASRPRRDPKNQSRRRSSRLLEESEPRVPILADVADVHSVLATLVDKHFQEYVANEIDTLASFMVKTKKCDNNLYVSHV
ncbi:hypothetical protein F5J12DRAFT_468640 [Pisolithus orientalis]|uniref:uncharacterized protein n=1 Tax=Pisolithus orientalis TaxID=936130 RepID=UPI002225B662|nr:uncharacterized protein F5J12DRAFT_468640 [Pisolithus orientalis]KAI5991303.1 hypothetical protein F5J12DRAFT_468640 [Pisolithus orientalis]